MANRANLAMHPIYAPATQLLCPSHPTAGLLTRPWRLLDSEAQRVEMQREPRHVPVIPSDSS